MQLVTIQLFTALQRQGELGLWAPLLGQEAAQVGSALALRSDDFVFGSYREHGVAYCRGVDPTQMLRFWRGSTQSGWDPYRYNMTTPAIIVGSQALHATGYGFAIADFTPGCLWCVVVAPCRPLETAPAAVCLCLLLARVWRAPKLQSLGIHQQPVLVAGPELACP